jgi:septum formation protein
MPHAIPEFVTHRPLILASSSPRRAEILKNAGIPFQVRSVHLDESVLPEESPPEYVIRLARAKAIAARTDISEIVLGADTTVVVDERILGKPENASDARRMLHLLAGRRHTVITGICLLRASEIVDISSTGVTFAAMTSEEIDEYVASGEPMDKAGGYAIQGRASKFISSIEGCYFNVVGLPVALVWEHLKKLR